MAIKEGLLILLIIGISDCFTSDRCPSKEDMPQCGCSVGAHDALHFTCGGGGKGTGMTIQDYIKIFQDNKLAEERDIRITFKGLAANSKIPSRAFEGFNIRTLEISYNKNITELADEEGGPAFVGLENILEKFESFHGINVPRKYDNYQQEKAPMSLGHLRKLREVEFNYNDINTFANGWFDKGPSSLEYLQMHGCNIRYFGDQAFAGLSNLREIRITQNTVESLSRSMFPNPANQLQKMDFEYNKLQYLSDDFFTNMPSLTDVFLTSNRITHIPEIVWRPVWSEIIHLVLSFNPLDCGEYISWMFDVKPPKHMWASCDAPKEMYGVDLGEFIKSKNVTY